MTKQQAIDYHVNAFSDNLRSKITNQQETLRIFQDSAIVGDLVVNTDRTVLEFAEDVLFGEPGDGYTVTNMHNRTYSETLALREELRLNANYWWLEAQRLERESMPTLAAQALDKACDYLKQREATFTK